MALTQGAWTTQVDGKSGLYVTKCNVAFTTAENDAYTLKTPKFLDTTKQWTLLIKFAATPDGTGLPVDLWGGYSDSFALSGDGASVAATDGFQIGQVLDDAVLAVDPLVYQITFDPNLPVANVVTVSAIASGLKYRIPILPHYAINFDGASTLNNTNVDLYIIQWQKD